jgi:hypothetical protein
MSLLWGEDSYYLGMTRLSPLLLCSALHSASRYQVTVTYCVRVRYNCYWQEMTTSKRHVNACSGIVTLANRAGSLRRGSEDRVTSIK